MTGSRAGSGAATSGRRSPAAKDASAGPARTPAAAARAARRASELRQASEMLERIRVRGDKIDADIADLRARLGLSV